MGRFDSQNPFAGRRQLFPWGAGLWPQTRPGGEKLIGVLEFVQISGQSPFSLNDIESERLQRAEVSQYGI